MINAEREELFEATGAILRMQRDSARRARGFQEWQRLSTIDFAMIRFVFILSGLPEKKKRSVDDDSDMSVIFETEIDVNKDSSYGR